MKKIVFLCPYFGSLPLEQTKLWLKTCSYNLKIDWIIITDDHTEFNHSPNVKFLYTSFEELKMNIQAKFDFTISLENPYKLCDFKPTYGYIFKDLLVGYDYWGHCDMSDCIFGDISKFLFEALKEDPEKVGFLGHMTLYKNTDAINQRFFLKSKSGVELNKILGTRINKAFDETEEYSINRIYLENNFSLKRVDDIYLDISPKFHEFKTSSWDDSFSNLGYKKWNYIVEWNNGKLYSVYLENNTIKKDEIGYVHYQKRKLDFKIDISQTNHFLIVPNQVLEYQDSMIEKNIKVYTKSKLFNFTLIKLKWKRLKLKFKELIYKLEEHK